MQSKLIFDGPTVRWSMVVGQLTYCVRTLFQMSYRKTILPNWLKKSQDLQMSIRVLNLSEALMMSAQVINNSTHSSKTEHSF